MKKKILIIGYSSFVRRRIIKSLSKIKNLEIYICSKSNKIDKKKRIFFNDYKESLNKKTFDLIYISLINNLHFKYAKIALNQGHNVIVDKPITLSFKQTNELLKIAKRKKVLLCELMIFNYHKVYKKIMEIIGGPKKLESIHANFNVPLTKKTKEISKIKGGCNFDMGPYAAAIIRLFFENSIDNFLILKNKFKDSSKKIVKDFSFLSKHKSKKFYANFGMAKEYISEIVFFGNGYIIKVPFQAFALSCHKKIKIDIKSKNRIYSMRIKDDYIKRFFQSLISSKINFNYYYEMINADNNLKKKLRLFN